MIKQIFLSSLILLSPYVSKKYDNNNVNQSFSISDQNQIAQYYKNIDTSSNENTLISLHNLLKTNQTKVNYESGDATSTSWGGFSLADRNLELSPFTQEELNSKKFKTSDIWVNIMYVDRPIYVSNKLNSGEYKYYSNITNGNLISGQFNSNSLGREHVFPKFYGFNGEDGDEYKKYFAGVDMHNLHTSDGRNNSTGHKNYPYGFVDETQNGDILEVSNNLTNTITGYRQESDKYAYIYEPADDIKGDIARSIFYMVARYYVYEEKDAINQPSPALRLGNDISMQAVEPNDTKNNPAVYGILDDLLLWNELDPVSEQEKQRNEIVYQFIQNNRNPFIDYPNWVNILFSNSQDKINLNIENGIDEYGFKIKLPSDFNTSYKINDTVNLSKITFEYINNDKSSQVIDPNLVNTYILDDNGNFNKLDETEFDITKNTLIRYEYKINNQTYFDDLTLTTSDNPLGNISLSISSDNLKTTYNLNDTISLEDFSVKLNNNGNFSELNKDQFNLFIKTPNNEEIKLNDTNSYTFNSYGKYQLYATYMFDDTLITSNKLEIIVIDQENTYIKINSNNLFKLNYGIFEPLELNKLDIEFYFNNSLINLDDSISVSYILTGPNNINELLNVKDEYMLSSLGEYNLHVEITYFDTTISSNTITLNVAISTFQYILIIIGVLIILIIVIFTFVLKNKKKSKKRKK